MASALFKNCTGKPKNSGSKPCNKEKIDAVGKQDKAPTVQSPTVDLEHHYRDEGQDERSEVETLRS